jgi:hypothetical protein
MPTVVYVLVANGRNRFSIMTLLSAACLKRMSPGTPITLLCDTLTYSAIRDDFSDLFKYFDNIVSMPVSIDDLRVRSRYLKTKIREAITGDIIYLDIDTLPIRDFSDVFNESWDIALVQDRNHNCPVQPLFPVWRSQDYSRLGWESPLAAFYNSGVVFMRDNCATRTLSDEWQRRWQQLFDIGREDDDQFALTSAIFHYPKLKILELDTSYNAMVAAHPSHAKNAKILHFYAGNVPDGSGTILDSLIRQYSEENVINWDLIDESTRRDYPWMPPYWPRRLWQTGNRAFAIKEFAKTKLSKIFK